jgi:hypothetical protein
MAFETVFNVFRLCHKGAFMRQVQMPMYLLCLVKRRIYNCQKT